MASFVDAALVRACERLSVELDAIGSHRRGPANRVVLRVHKQADTDLARLQRGDDTGQSFRLRARPPAGLAGDFAWRDWDERALVGPHLFDQRDEVGPGIPFDVEFDMRLAPRKHRRHLAHIVGGDVALVGARVNGDAIHASGDADANCIGHTRKVSSARVAKRGDLVDVDRKVNHDVPRFTWTTSTISWAHARISPSLRPSSMTRRSG